MNVGDVVTGKIHQERYTLTKMLGQGGQGFVFRIESPVAGSKALKWYFEEQATPEQYDAIMSAIQTGSPDEESGKVFIWPYDIIEIGNRFGYVMNLIDTERFVGYGDMTHRPDLVPNIRTRCMISYNLVHAYQQLHLRGYCYRDISDGNFLFDPKTGEVVICDNDNVGVETQSQSQVLGTLEYMAPEVIKGKVKPGTSTDLYSLAILLFKFWVWHHPYHGMLEYSIKNWDLAAKKWLYGETPVFIFDKVNKANKLPDVEEYGGVQKMWELLPDILKDAFYTSFTAGVTDVSARLREFDWVNIFRTMLDSVFYCTQDNAENFYQTGKVLQCWHCKKVLQTPPILEITSCSGTHEIALTSNSKLFGAHLDEFHENYNAMDVVSTVSRNPYNDKVWGLLNNSDRPWVYTFSDGRTVTVAIGKNAPLLHGSIINFGEGVTGKVVVNLQKLGEGC